MEAQRWLTINDLLAWSGDEHVELIDGEIVQRPMRRFEQGQGAQSGHAGGDQGIPAGCLGRSRQRWTHGGRARRRGPRVVRQESQALPADAWYLAFNDGYDDWHEREAALQVRQVRAGQ